MSYLVQNACNSIEGSCRMAICKMAGSMPATIGLVCICQWFHVLVRLLASNQTHCRSTKLGDDVLDFALDYARYADAHVSAPVSSGKARQSDALDLYDEYFWSHRTSRCRDLLSHASWIVIIAPIKNPRNSAGSLYVGISYKSLNVSILAPRVLRRAARSS